MPPTRPLSLGTARPIAVLLALLILLPTLASAYECLTLRLPKPTEDYATIRARLEAEGQWKRASDPALAPPEDPQVGDTWLWYVWDLGGFPVANLKPATVRGMGDHCYVVVDDDEWNVTMNQDDVDRIVQQFDQQSVGDFPDQGVWDLNTSHFGPPPDFDGLDRVFLFYYRFNIAADGYFWVFDQFPDGSQAFASNECDVVYMATDSGQPASDYMIAVMAHEFEHLIHFNQDPNEVPWVDEGLAGLAMWLYGRPDTISGFNSQPDNSLLVWNGVWADYIKTYLWTLYIYEQYGGQPTIWEVTHEPANSMQGYKAALSRLGYLTPTEDIFGDWAVANFLDDTSVPDGQYGYAGDDLPPFLAFITHNNFPASFSSSVQPHATDYVRLTNLTAPPTVTFNGADARDFRVTLMATDPVLPTVVQPVDLDEFQDGAVTFHDAAGYAQVIIAIANVSLSGTGLYQYSVEEGITSVGDLPTLAASLGAHPNPFNPRTSFSFSVPQADEVALTVHDVRGREVARLFEGHREAGRHEVVWEAGAAMPAGVYFGRLTVGGREAAACKVSVVK
jgi:hypothetical protein